MEWEDEDNFEDQGELEDPEHSLTNSFTEGRLQQEYRNFTRPQPHIEAYRQAASAVEVMTIDVTYSNKQVRDSQGTSSPKQAGP